jgi:serine/threonine protein kinase
LHKLGITHNNLHPSNVLTVNQDDDGLRVKIADFGHASRDGIKNHSNLNYTKTERCTIKARNIFQAPEHVTTQASDMWSVGALLCFCITGGEILHEKSHERLVQKLQGDMGKTNGKYASLSRCGKQLLCALLHADPTVRLTVAEALEHKWFADTQEHIQSGIKKAESIPGQRGRGQKQSLRKFRDSSHSESDRRSSTFTHSVTKMVQHFSNRKS